MTKPSDPPPVADLSTRTQAIEALQVGIAIADARQPDCPLVYCNDAFQTITGYNLSEVLGRNCRFLQGDDRNQDARQQIRNAVQKGKYCKVLIRNYRKDGAMFWNELSLSPMRDAEGQLTHFVGLASDVTTRVVGNEKRREREARLQAILDTAVEAIITIDERGRCESINAAVEKMFGYTAEELLGNNISVLMPEPFHSEHDGYLTKYMHTGEQKVIGIGREAYGLHKDGHQFPIRLSVSEIQLDRRRLFTGIIHDITEQKSAEKRLVQSERLAVLGEAMARLAHESRNALQRIQIAVETARVYADGLPPLLGQLDAIERANDSLNALLEELRNYAAPLHLERKEVSLASAWREAWNTVSHHLTERKVELIEQSADPEAKANIDRFRIAQVFRNLFENSLAACDDPVRIVVAVEKSDESGAPRWRISVSDNGPGLDIEQARRVFEPFFTTKAKGTGLGMAIARRIVESHGGTIAVVAAATGAQFDIELPA
ncbi:PAS domain S-box protein [Aeoliella mucimassa]|nr:PAS domain S-box protein [Aeoliella mucimassa]